MNSCIKTKNAGPLEMPAAETLGIVRDLTGIVSYSVTKRAFRTSEVVRLWLPLYIGRRIELADLELGTAVFSKGADRTIHDIT